MYWVVATGGLDSESSRSRLTWRFCFCSLHSRDEDSRDEVWKLVWELGPDALAFR